ncbi:MAG: hypothetical protein ACR2N1_00645 [Rubripirellula sp.]
MPTKPPSSLSGRILRDQQRGFPAGTKTQRSQQPPQNKDDRVSHHFKLTITPPIDTGGAPPAYPQSGINQTLPLTIPVERSCEPPNTSPNDLRAGLNILPPLSQTLAAFDVKKPVFHDDHEHFY